MADYYLYFCRGGFHSLVHTMISKTKIFQIILIAVVCAWVFDVFLGRSLTAKISTLPLLNRWKILNPQTPIVINNRETVRVEKSGDEVEAIAGIKTKTSLIILVGSGGSVTVTGAAINLTSDGGFVTGSSSFAKNQGNYFVVLSDGRSAKITGQVSDPTTSLEFFKAEINKVPLASLAESKNLNVGDKVIFVNNSLQNFFSKAAISRVVASQKDIAGQTFLADYPRNSFAAQANSPLLSGQALIDANADIVGIWNGSNIIPSNLLKSAMGLFFADNQKITRPSFGFSYAIITANESKLGLLAEGALVKDASGLSAKQAGMLPGDIITRFDNADISQNIFMDEILQKYKPGDVAAVNVIRAGKNIMLKLTVGELK